MTWAEPTEACGMALGHSRKCNSGKEPTDRLTKWKERCGGLTQYEEAAFRGHTHSHTQV